MYSWALITGDTPATVDARMFRQALGAFPTGVCLVTTVTEDGKREGMTINSFASVSLTPPLVLWSIRNDARSADAFLSGRVFIISVMAADQREMASHFARPAPDKFSDWEDSFDLGIAGCPRLKNSAASFECTTYSRYQEGDHTLLLGRVENFSSNPVPPLFFHAGQMGSLWEMAEVIAKPA